jgi:hypothetical protein
MIRAIDTADNSYHVIVPPTEDFLDGFIPAASRRGEL